MRNFTKSTALLILAFLSFSLQFLNAQVIDPADPVITYNSAAPPAEPAFGQIGKWVRTVRLGWNTDSWKAYIINGMPFRVKFPLNYTVNDGKKYPMMVFFHGLGETGTKYDNEWSLANGGTFMNDAINSGRFDGFVLIPQSTGGWGASLWSNVSQIIDYMVVNNKLDAFRVSVNGLSAGGYGTWDFIINYPQYTASALPMSGISLYYKGAPIEKYKYTPMWYFQGGLDGSPDPNTALEVKQAINAAGGNLKYTLYPDLGHGTWDRAWSEADFLPWISRVYGSNPYALFGRTEFCPGDNININVGVAPGFQAYEWRKDGNLIVGAITNNIQVTSIGVYSCRVKRLNIWSDWSRVPVEVKYKTPTVTPPITVSGIMSRVLPALDTTAVTLMLPAGYASYVWQKVGNNTTISTTNTVTVSTPGDYVAKATELYGCSSSFSTPFTVVNANGANKPSAAANLQAAAVSKTSVRLDWSDNPAPAYNETNYEVYQSLNAATGYKLIAITSADATTYTAAALKANTRYYYKVRAVNNFAASAASNVANAITEIDAQAPSAPGNLRVTVSTRSSVSFAWDASTDDVGVVGYDIYLNGAKVYTTKNTTYSIEDLDKNLTYVIQVKAKDAAGNISVSSQVTAQTLSKGLVYKHYTFTGTWNALPDFSLLTPSVTGMMPEVAITPRLQDENFAFLWEGYITIPTTGYYYFRTNSDDGSRLWLGARNGTASPYSFTATPLVNNDGLHGSQDVTSSQTLLLAGSYPIAMAFYEQGGGENMVVSWRTPATGANYVVIPATAYNDAAVVNGTAPAKPTNLTATSVNYKRINLAWTDASNNETGFEIWRSTARNSGFLPVATKAANSTSFVDTFSLAANTTYYYKVRAINQYGESAFNVDGAGVAYSYYQQSEMNNLPNFAALTPTATGRVDSFYLTGNREDDFAFKYEGKIYIPVTGNYNFFTTSDDGSKLYLDAFTEANLVVSNDYLQGPTERGGTKNLTAGYHNIYATFFERGGGQFFEVRYEGPAGSNISKQLIPSSVLGEAVPSATTGVLPGVPNAPASLLATKGSTSTVNLTWTENATNETGFEIWRSNNTNSNYIKVAQTAANMLAFTDTALFGSSIYYYKVRAVGVGGNSAYSNEDSAKTAGNPPVIGAIANQNFHYQQAAEVAISATDPDGGVITFSASGLPASVTLQNISNGIAKLVFTPNGTQSSGAVTITATDETGETGTKTFTLVINNNYSPVIASIGNVTLVESSSTTLNLTATDQNAADVLTWTVNGLPNAFTLTPGSNGAATLALNPNFAAAGLYAVEVKVTDGNGGTATSTFNYTVTDKSPNKSIYTRVQYATVMGAPWNNIGGPSTTNLKDETGAVTNVGLQFQQPWWMPYNAGPTTGNNSGVYPDAVLNDLWYFGYYGGPETASVAVTGLDPAKKYNLTFFASSVFGGSDNGNTNYAVGSKTTTLYVQNNFNNTATIGDLSPAADGSIMVNMSKAANAPIGYLNALIITEVFNDGTAPAAPKALTAELVSTGAKLTWQDPSYNETGFEVSRSTSSGGTYTVIGTAEANATTYADNTVSGATSYFYKVKAINGIGGSPFSNIANVTTTNKIPVLTAIADVVVKSGQIVNVNVTATDDATDVIKLTAKGLPAFATFTDNGNGTGVVKVQPGAGIQGVYSGITITATDLSDSARTVGFSIYVVDANIASTYLNFTNDLQAAKPWNNLYMYQPYQGTNITDLKDDGNLNTGMSVTLTNAWSGAAVTGVRFRNGTELYPEAASRSCIYISDANTRTITVAGLDPNKRYNFVFYGSHGVSENATTKFTIGATTVTLNASYNNNKTVQINNITPAANGVLTITVAKDAAALYGILSAMVIQSYTPNAVATFSPSDLRVINQKTNAITLQWQDRASNETGYEVYRSTNGGSSYSLLTTTAANVTTYTSSSLTPNSAYVYRVRAKNGSTYSDYSNAVTTYTYETNVYVNLNTANYAAPSPWNNLNWQFALSSTWNNFKNEDGTVTNLGLIQPVKWDGPVNPGVNTGNNSGVYPDKVMFESFGLFPGNTANVRVTGLNFTKAYDFDIFASLTGYGQDCTSEYTINGKMYMLNANLNKSGVLTVYGITPDENGEVMISVKAAPGATFGLLGALVIHNYNTPSGFAGQAAAASKTANVVALDKTADVVNITSKTSSIVATVSNDNVELAKSIVASPNPFESQFNVVIPSTGKDAISVSLYDVTGREVYRQPLGKLARGNSTIYVEGGNLKAGVYILKVAYTDSRLEQSIKLIKR